MRYKDLFKEKKNIIHPMVQGYQPRHIWHEMYDVERILYMLFLATENDERMSYIKRMTGYAGAKLWAENDFSSLNKFFWRIHDKSLYCHAPRPKLSYHEINDLKQELEKAQELEIENDALTKMIPKNEARTRIRNEFTGEIEHLMTDTNPECWQSATKMIKEKFHVQNAIWKTRIQQHSFFNFEMKCHKTVEISMRCHDMEKILEKAGITI